MGNKIPQEVRDQIGELERDGMRSAVVCVPAYMSFPTQHRTKLHSMLEQNNEWAVQRARYITLESIAPVGDDPIVGLPIAAG